MNVLSRYLSWRLAQYVMITTFLLSSLALAFDLMQEWDDVTRTTRVAIEPLLMYSVLRLPQIVAEMLPVGSILGGIFLFGLMMRNSELVAAWAGGASASRMMIGLLPVGVALMSFQFILNDRLVPSSLTELYGRQVGDYQRDLTMGADMDAVWLRSGNDIIRLPTRDAHAGRIEDGRVFRREPNGMLIEQIDFRGAEPGDEGWILHEVRRHSATTGETIRQARFFWRGRIDIENLPLIAGDITELPLTSIGRLIDNGGFGQRPTSLYETWFHHRLASALPPFLLVCLVVSLAQRFRRSGGIVLLAVSSLGLGFAFLVFDNTAFAFGEVGLIAPWAAAWLPKITLGLLIAYLVTRHEG